MNIGERIRQKRLELGLSQLALSEKCGWDSAGRVSNYENGSRHPKSKDVITLAEMLGVTPEWLQFGNSPLHATSGFLSLGAGTPPLPVGKIPLLTWQDILKLQADHSKFYLDLDIENNTAIEYLPVYSDYPKGSFALPVEGDSMASLQHFSISFKEGMTLYVDPARIPLSGHYVICKLNNGQQAAFRQYVIDSGVAYLKPLNPQYPLVRMDDATQIVGVVVEYKGKLV